MWEIKYFKEYELAKKFMLRNNNRYRCELIFVHNGYVVEYKKLQRIY